MKIRLPKLDPVHELVIVSIVTVLMCWALSYYGTSMLVEALPQDWLNSAWVEPVFLSALVVYCSWCAWDIRRMRLERRANAVRAFISESEHL